MVKVRANISIDEDVKAAVEIETEKNGFCLSRFINAYLRNKLKVSRERKPL